MQIHEIMTKDVKTVGPDTPVVEIARLMRDEDIGAVPVAEDDKLIGMITDRDIVVRGLADPQFAPDVSARSVMSERALYCFDHQTVEEVLDNMGDLQVRRLPVVDRDKRLVGMVSLGDLSANAQPQHSGESLRGISAPSRH